MYVGKGVGVDRGEDVGLGVQVGGNESEEEEEGVSVSIRSNDTLKVRFEHADRSVSSNNGMILALVVIFPLCLYLCLTLLSACILCHKLHEIQVFW